MCSHIDTGKPPDLPVLIGGPARRILEVATSGGTGANWQKESLIQFLMGNFMDVLFPSPTASPNCVMYLWEARLAAIGPDKSADTHALNDETIWVSQLSYPMPDKY